MASGNPTFRHSCTNLITSPGAATKAVVQAFVRINLQASGVFSVEGATPPPLPPALVQVNHPTHNRKDGNAGFYIFG